MELQVYLHSVTLNICYCSIINNWIGHKFHNLEASSPIHTYFTVLFQWASTIKIQLSVLVKYKADLPSLECNLFSPWYSWRIAYFALNSKYSVIQCNIRYLRALRKRYPFCLYNHGGILDFHFHNVHQYSSIYQKH